MRIEKLIFRNLNSIAGTWEIDFTNSDFQTSGLFAITGPTGSGKSTILDAISLALYGRTPRQEKISKTVNSLMTIGFDDCASQLVFQAEGNRYQATWFQTRNDKDGGLRQAKARLEIYDPDLQRWNILSSKLTECQDEVAKVTGLTYTQFGRSVLLAQGQFESFLKVRHDERAKSLEQITGTEVYAEISSQVYKRSSAADKKLKDLQLQQESNKPLSPEELQQKKDLFEKLDSERKSLTDQRTDLNSAIDWVERYEKLSSKKGELEDEKKRLGTESISVEATRQAIENAQKANGIQHLFISLSNQRKEIEGNKKEIKTKVGELAAENNKKAQLIEEKERLKQQKSDHEQLAVALSELIKKVRPLDNEIANAKKDEQRISLQMKNKKQEVRQEKDKLKEKEKQVQELEQDQRLTQDWLDKHLQDAVLPSERDDITSAKTRWLSEVQDLSLAKSKIGTKRTEYENDEKAHKKTKEDSKQAEQDLNKAIETLQHTEQELKSLLGNASKDELSEGRIEITQKLADLNNAIKAADAFERNQDSIAGNNQERKQLESEKQSQTLLTKTLQDLVNGYEQQIKDIELKLRIASLEERRTELKEGEPCPLCGSLEHPYCINIPESGDSLLKQKEEVDKKKATEDNNLSNAKVAKANAETQLGNKEKELSDLEKDRDRLNSECEGFANKLSVEWNGDPIGFKMALSRLQGELSSKEDDLKNKLQKVSALEQKQKEETTIKTEAEDKDNSLKVKLSGLQEKVKASKQAWEQAEREEAQKQQILEEDLGAIQNRWNSFSISPISQEGLLDFLQSLLDKEIEYSKQKKKKDELNSQLNGERALEGIYRQTFSEKTAELNTIEGDLSQITQKLQGTSAERWELFQDKDCTQEEEKTKKEGDQIQSNLDTNSNLLSQTENRIIALSSTKESLEGANQKLIQKELDDSQTWSKELIAKGFLTEQLWQDALMDEKAIQEKTQSVNKFDTKVKENNAQLQAYVEQIEDEKQKRDGNEKLKKLAHLSVPSLKELLQQVATQQGEVDTAYTKLALELENDKKIREDSQNIAKEIEKWKVICDNWRKLNDLIGKADGAKYRDFAQALSFKILIDNANGSLEWLYPRYKLCARKNAPLELDVIDNEMFELTRPTSNLSGGESFVVSLALALGLADMAGQKVRIDSLFLDEGFGTLDDESLERVLSVLDKLRIKGKLIGLISHVDKIRETIFPQINVIAEAQGLSRLAGCGVTHLSEKKSFSSNK